MTAGYSSRPRIIDGPIHEEWMDHAACLGSDVDVFFPPRGSSCAEAKAICAVCSVRGACLEYALRNHEKHGIFGGLTERERRAVRRSRRVA